MGTKEYNPHLYNVVAMRPRNRLYALRKAAKLTQAQLAARTGVSQSAISQIENDVLSMDVNWMRAFARELGCAPVDLLDGADNPYKLEPDERALIDDYRNADEIQRGLTRRVAAPVVEYRAPSPDPDEPVREDRAA